MPPLLKSGITSAEPTTPSNPFPRPPHTPLNALAHPLPDLLQARKLSVAELPPEFLEVALEGVERAEDVEDVGAAEGGVAGELWW